MKSHQESISRLTLVAALCAAGLGLPALAASPDGSAPGRYRLDDGTTLVVADNGGMRMFTIDGKRLPMKEGVAMKTRDGKVVVMKEDPNWKLLRQFGTLSPRSH